MWPSFDCSRHRTTLSDRRIKPLLSNGQMTEEVFWEYPLSHSRRFVQSMVVLESRSLLIPTLSSPNPAHCEQERFAVSSKALVLPLFPQNRPFGVRLSLSCISFDLQLADMCCLAEVSASSSAISTVPSLETPSRLRPTSTITLATSPSLGALHHL